MSTSLNKIPRSWAGDAVVDAAALGAGAVTTAKIADNAVTGAKASASLRAAHLRSSIPTIPTSAGTTEVLMTGEGAGTVTLVKVTFKEALTQHATNIVTFALVNKGQAGVGTTAVLAATDANTTKTSTGNPIAAYTSFVCTLNATGANLVLAVGDVLAFQVTGAGTLANTLTEGHVKITVDQLA